MSGTLYLCATPIGNLRDITQRVLDTLAEVDLIAAEDTRNTIKLLNHFQIKKPMTSYHEFNKFEKAEELIGLLQQGKNIALVTDAGTPAISDPGEVLVRRCREEELPVTSLPGCCALITALTLSGLPTRRFCFEGFLPREKKERRQILEELKKETRTIIMYEAPHHLQKTLVELGELLGNRKIVLCKELTKKFESVMEGRLVELAEYFEENEPRGEYVLVLEGADRQELLKETQRSWEEMSLSEHMAFYEEQGYSNKDSMKLVAKDRGVTKREIYQELLSGRENEISN